MIKNIGKYAGLAAGIGVLLGSASFVLAQTQKSPTPASVTTTNQNAASIEQRKIQALQNIATTTVKKIIESAVKTSGEAMQNLEKIRVEAQEKIKQTVEKAQQKITEIRDEQKQQQALQIANQLDHLNQQWTEHFTQVLNRLEVILEKIKNRADKAAANANDVSAVDAAISAAETAISNARAAVETQAKKTYTVDLTAVSSGIATTTTTAGQNQLIINLRAQFKTLKDQLEKNLTSLRDGLMKDARTAVQKALEELIKVPNVDVEPTATSTSQGQ
jgi:hypothetical protein